MNILILQSLANSFAFSSTLTTPFVQICPLAHGALMEETLLLDDGDHHRVVNIAMVTICSGLSERKAKAVSRREKPRIERTLVSSDGMGDRILVHPGRLRDRLHGEGRWTEVEVLNRDAIAVAGRCVRVDRRRCIGGSCRSRAATSGSQDNKKARSQQAQPDFCGEKRVGFMHFSSFSALL